MIPQPQVFKDKPEKLLLFVAAALGIPGSLSLTRSLQVGERKARSPSQSKETGRPI